MKSAAFDLHQPSNVAAALQLLANAEQSVKVMGGGQSLGPMLNLRLAQPEVLVHVARLPEMLTAKMDGDSLLMGAGVTHASIEDCLVPDVTRGLMPYVAANIAYRAIRNRGTIGGSLAHADPAADWVNTMMLLGASMQITSLDAQGASDATGHQREVVAHAFMQGPFTTALADNEILTAIRIPVLSSSARWGYYKFCRKTGEFAEAIGGVLSDPERGIHRVLIGATDNVPIVIHDAKALINASDSASITRILHDAGMAADPYAFKMHHTALIRAIAMLHQQA
jgi:carbon-monoxide dehydrogenase medium subunit